MRIVGSMKHKGIAAQNSAIYNSNNQKLAEPQLSTRNAPAQQHFGAQQQSSEHGGCPILRDLPIGNHNLQKSGEPMHSKVDRQNSFALYPHQGKRTGGGSMAGTFGNKLTTHQQHQINQLKSRVGGTTVESGGTAEGFHAREPNETHTMKARPSTSTRLAHGTKHVFGPSQQQFASSMGPSASQNLKFHAGRQVFTTRTMETNNVMVANNPGH